jgi:hypothetical protein
MYISHLLKDSEAQLRKAKIYYFLNFILNNKGSFSLFNFNIIIFLKEYK